MLHGDVTVRVSEGPGRRGCARISDSFLPVPDLEEDKSNNAVKKVHPISPTSPDFESSVTAFSENVVLI